MSDRVRLGPIVRPGVRRCVRDRDGKIVPGELFVTREGESLQAGAEFVEVAEAGVDGWHDVTSLYKHCVARTTSGPAQVATDAYRSGYDRIFGKQKVGSA